MPPLYFGRRRGGGIFFFFSTSLTNLTEKPTMERITKLSIERGMRIVSHFDERTGKVEEDTVTLLTETEELEIEQLSFEMDSAVLTRLARSSK
jgi:hypothetical protein